MSGLYIFLRCSATLRCFGSMPRHLEFQLIAVAYRAATRRRGDGGIAIDNPDNSCYRYI